MLADTVDAYSACKPVMASGVGLGVERDPESNFALQGGCMKLYTDDVCGEADKKKVTMIDLPYNGECRLFAGVIVDKTVSMYW